MITESLAAEKNLKVIFKGTLIDPVDKLKNILAIPRTCQDISKGKIKNISTILDTLGYKVQSLRCQSGRMTIALTLYKVIRKIYVKGNWPLFEEEILRRLRFRPGQRLPEGPALAEAIASQEERMKLFLSKEGFFDGSLRIKITPTSIPHEVNMEVRVLKGKSYEVGEVKINKLSSLSSQEGSSKPKKLAIPDEEIADQFFHDNFLYSCLKKLYLMRGFNTQRLSDDTEELVKRFHDKGYPGVRVKKGYDVIPNNPPGRAVRINLDIQERKQIIIKYEGNNDINEKQLNNTLTIFEEGAYDDYELEQSVKKIHHLYQSKGFLQARIDFSRKIGEKKDVVTFHIHEGPEYKIEEVAFIGNKKIDDDQLYKVIKTRTFPLLGYIGLGEGGYLTDLQLAQDVERIKKAYKERGFHDVKVVGEIAPEPALFGRPGALAAAVASGSEESDRDLYVRFTIDEGPQAVVEEVTINQNKSIDTETLLSNLALKPGQPFTDKTLQLDEARLVRIYSERGFPYAEVMSMQVRDIAGTHVSIQFTVVEHDPVRFGPIFIRGNFKTRESVILSDLEFNSGEPFDIRKVEESETALRKHQIFNVVRIQLLGMAEKQSEIPVLVTVEERYDDYGSIEIGVGGSTDNLLFGSLAYTNRNLFGLGTSVTLKGELGMKIQSGSVQYRDPRIFGSTFAFGVEGYVRNQLTERLGEVQTFGVTTSVSKELLAHLNGLLRFELRRVTHKEDLDRPEGIEEQRTVDVFTTIGAIGPALEYDRRDNPLSPTSGFRLQGSMLWASRYLLGTDDFIKFNLSGQAFIPLPKDLSIAFGVRYDHAIPLGGTVTLPEVERYFAGGDTTIRGLEQDRAWTEIIEVPLAPYSNAMLLKVRPQGGTIRLLTNLEFQYPIWKESVLFGLPIMGAIFLDNGMVTNSFEAFHISDFRHGLGLSWRIVTPVGFFSFDFPAFILDPGPGDDVWRMHINFGVIF